jgi:lantibiotic modifying enzyme
MNKAAPHPRLESAAAAGLHHATQWMQTADIPSALSVFSGKLGVSYAISHSGLDSGSLAHASKALLDEAQQAFSSVPERQYLDIINGSSGAILVLLALYRLCPSPSLIEFACALGHDICRRADWTGAYCTWDCNEVAGFDSLPLGGFSHGASGIAAALMGLYAVTTDRDFMTTALGAYAYEDTLYDIEHGNWLDLRDANSVEEARAKPDGGIAWCHGAVGILLSRKIASDAGTKHAQRHREAIAHAAASTLQALQQDMAHSRYDTTLCHGLSGLLESLVVASQVLNDPAYTHAASEAAAELVTRYGPFCTWPSGIPGGAYHPSLMQGIAGVGLTLLRLSHRNQIPSVLSIS